ncbi:carboxylate-amine ligase [Amycolatopsis jiangsuensis]|uniref:Putative glutamate--cysteine ligase 2 n=1 Tax=Amycolatopsis jiangsuensis TaxID=1181879 RepID=A0A840J6W4_9PSEU|nr:glutamate--cysteine ligase [Amycolatopsis jiangsuensis]MBB4689128.1 carboxylate-amine ligase [Amycolatopsis jiangsuensis]
MSSPSAARTLGVEEEFLLLHPCTGTTSPCAERVLARVRHARLPDGATVQRELRPSQIELATGVCGDAAEIWDQLVAGRRLLAAAAAAEDCALIASGTPPLAPGSAAPGQESGRYRGIDDTFGGLVGDYEACGCHVHVGVEDRDTAVAVVNHLGRWLPVLLALSANSPFDRGHDTGYHSWRMVLQSRFPGSGLAPQFRSHDEWQRSVGALVDCGALVDPDQTFWLARVSPRLPTVELRVADVSSTVEGSVLQAVLARALVDTALTDLACGIEAEPLSPQVCAAAVWAASRYGLTGALVDPLAQRRRPAGELVAALLAHVRPALAACGDEALAGSLVREVLWRGTGSVTQLATAADGLPAVVRSLMERTVPSARREPAPAG